jgi:hypothetical protein
MILLVIRCIYPGVARTPSIRQTLACYAEQSIFRRGVRSSQFSNAAHVRAGDWDLAQRHSLCSARNTVLQSCAAFDSSTSVPRWPNGSIRQAPFENDHDQSSDVRNVPAFSIAAHI